MKLNRTAFGLAALPLAAAVHANPPQSNDMSPWAVRMGTGWFTDSLPADNLGDLPAAFGLSYFMSRRTFLGGENGMSSIDFDFYTRGSSGEWLTQSGLTYVERIPINGTFYYGLGVGVFHNSARQKGAGGGGSSGGSSGGGSGGGSGVASNQVVRGNLAQDMTFRNTQLGALFLLGYRFNENSFVEASVKMSGKLEDAQTGTINLMFGYRF